MCSGLRKTPDEVLDGMDLEQTRMLARYWERNPQMLFGAAVGFDGPPPKSSPRKATGSKYATSEEVQQLLAMYGPRKV